MSSSKFILSAIFGFVLSQDPPPPDSQGVNHDGLGEEVPDNGLNHDELPPDHPKNMFGIAEDAVFCDLYGNDAEYTETIRAHEDAEGGMIRVIQANGCPNHESACMKGEGCHGQGIHTEAVVRNISMTLPAYPCIAEQPYDVSCSPGTIGIMINGVPIFGKWGGPPCDDAVEREGPTFDPCSGHATPDGKYHYHTPPACLMDQLSDSMTPSPYGHSPHIGWALDGFPIYGPHGTDGHYIYSCTHPMANAADCLDECNGHAQHTQDGYLYHYHTTGPMGDLESMPLFPQPGLDQAPYTIGCLKGVPFDLSLLRGLDDANLTCSDERGTDDQFVAEPKVGVTELYDRRWTETEDKLVTPAPINNFIADQEGSAASLRSLRQFAYFAGVVCCSLFFL